MLLLEGVEIEKYYGSKKILDTISFKIYHGETIGLVGKNGTGKTTLLRILVGEDEDYTGEIHGLVQPSYLPQSLIGEKDMLVEDFLMTHDEDYGQVLMWFNRLQMKKDLLLKRMDTCSGGELTRLYLVKMMASQRELLLLDEPSNHLDVEMFDWLIQSLKEYRGGILMVSHNRFLLNTTVDVIWELDRSGTLREYRGDYDFYIKKKEEEERREWQEYHKYQEEKRRIKTSISRQRVHVIRGDQGPERRDSFWRLLKGSDRRTGQMAAKIPALKSRLEKLERIEKPMLDKEIEMDLIPRQLVHAQTLIEGRSISKSFSRKEVLKDLSFRIPSQARVALVGPNGIGKTVLLDCIRGELEIDRGELFRAKGVEIGYLSQHLDHLPQQKRIIEVASLVNPTLKEELVRTVLGSLGFTGEEVEKRVEYFSFGERVRLGFGCLLLSKANLLLLDEPLNHLDIYLREVVVRALTSYPGTILMVSHDYYSIEKIASEIWELTDRGLYIFKGGFKEYREEKRGREKEKREESLDHVEGLVESMRRAVIAERLAKERREKGYEEDFLHS